MEIIQYKWKLCKTYRKLYKTNEKNIYETNNKYTIQIKLYTIHIEHYMYITQMTKIKHCNV